MSPDPNIQRRNRSSKRRGAAWEITLVSWLREHFHPDTERISRKGSRDEGDVVAPINDTHVLIIEAKNVQRMNLSDWLRQAEAEAKRWEEDRSGKYAWPVVVIKRRSHVTGKAYVVMEADKFFGLIG